HRSKVSFYRHLDVDILHHPILYCTQAGTAIKSTNLDIECNNRLRNIKEKYDVCKENCRRGGN
ncbi:MAG: hypothetical protein V7K89_16835, partial [Nostoc sp.]|uniref:hypothetical protein n=1 Tax=Nostoc sp. TaxID=1180 RepID=UPI002FF545A7